MAYTKYSLTPANNNAAPPDGAPEGMLPSAVNDTMRDMMAQIRDVGDGIRGGTYTMTAPIITGGTITGVALTGNTFTSPVISGGSINNTPIGATTASTGAFSTLSATGVTTVQAGSVSAPAITTTGDTNTGIFFPAADTIAFTEGGAESMRIDSSGRVGIGTSSPSCPLDVLSNSSAVGVSIRGRSSDNISLYNFTSNDSGTQYGFILGSPTELRLTQNGANVITAYTNGAERMRIDSSGNVGIGTSSPAYRLQVVNGTSNYAALGNGASSGGASALFMAGASNQLSWAMCQNFHVAGALTFAPSTANGGFTLTNPYLTLNNTGAVVLKDGNTSATGTGIAFPATQSASSDANTLDDYEEGTWTPVIAGTTLAGVTTYGSSRTGVYTKIGNVVTIQFTVTWTVATGTGTLEIRGMPFTTASTQFYNNVGSVMAENIDLPNSGANVSTYSGSGTTYMNLYVTIDNAGLQPVNMDSSGTLFGSLTYFV